MHVSFTGAGRDALDLAILRAPAHLRPAFLAVRDQGCAFVLAAQGRGRFVVPADRPCILVIGDDLAAALGPGGFHDRSLRRYLARCQAVAVVAGAPTLEAYAAPCTNATALRQDVAIIETRPEREGEWLALLREVAPDAAVLLSTTAAGSA